MKIGLVLGGDPPSSEDMRLLDACDFVVCADAGARPMLRAERPPDLIVGDLDSLDAEAYKWADALGITLERHPEAKDETDGELALRHVLARKPQSVLILGGHGGRTSMFLGNLKLLRRCHENGVDASMVGHGESMRFLSAGDELALAGRHGAILNVLPVDGDAVVSVHGTQWEVEKERLSGRSVRGVSNPIISDGARIRLHEGKALVVVERPDQSPK